MKGENRISQIIMRVRRIEFLEKNLYKNILNMTWTSYLWIQLEESVAKKLEKEEVLLENIYYEYKDNG